MAPRKKRLPCRRVQGTPDTVFINALREVLGLEPLGELVSGERRRLAPRDTSHAVLSTTHNHLHGCPGGSMKAKLGSRGRSS